MITTEVKRSRDERKEELKNDLEFQTHIGDLKSLVSLYKRVQEDRIRMGNRNKLKKDGSEQKENEFGKNNYPISKNQEEFMKILLEHLKNYEDIIVERFKEILKEDRIYDEFISNVPGIGPRLSIVLLSHFRPENVYYATQLISYAGIAPESKRVKGEKTNYPPFLKARLLGVLCSSFLKCSSPYSIYWYDYKLRKLKAEEGKAKDDRKKLMHINRMANRHMIKMFLVDYFLAVSSIYQMEVPLSYLEENGLEHVGETYFTYEEFLNKKPKLEKFKKIVVQKRKILTEYMLKHGWKEEEVIEE